MPAVALAWESQSTRRVGCSAVARQAARFTAVVVLPTPPFWFATAMIRAKYSPESENLAKVGRGCKMFHVEQRLDGGNRASEGGLFHVEHSRMVLDSPNLSCSTWNNDLAFEPSMAANQGNLLKK